jgi:hypothetical protein
MATDRNGRFYVFADHLAQLYDPAGKYLATIGRVGTGPGETMGAAFPVALPGDSVLVVQPVLSRAAVYDPQLKFARNVSLPGRFAPGRVIQWPDSVLLVGLVHTPDRFGFPFHIVSMATPSASLTLSGGPDEVRLAEAETHIVAQQQRCALWTVKNSAFELTQWDTQLRPIRKLVRVPSWWPTNTDFKPLGTPTSPPTPTVNGLVLDDRGLLWVFTRVADPEWREAWPKEIRGDQEILGKDIPYAKLLDTIIEVIDPAAGRVVTRARWPHHTAAALSGPRAAAYMPTADGVPQIRVYKLSVVGEIPNNRRNVC